MQLSSSKDTHRPTCAVKDLFRDSAKLGFVGGEENVPQRSSNCVRCCAHTPADEETMPIITGSASGSGAMSETIGITRDSSSVSRAPMLNFEDSEEVLSSLRKKLDDGDVESVLRETEAILSFHQEPHRMEDVRRLRNRALSSTEFVERAIASPSPSRRNVRSLSNERNISRENQDTDTTGDTNAETRSSDERRKRIRRFIEDPGSSRSALVFALLVLFCIVVATIAFIVESLPQYHDDDGAADLFFYLEAGLVAVFTIELVMRFYSRPSNRAFFASFLIWIDILAVVPLYIEAGFRIAGKSSNSLASVGIIRAVRLLRVGRIMKFSRFVRGSEIMTAALSRSFEVLWFITMSVFIFTTLSGAGIFFLERGSYDSVRQAFVDDNGQVTDFQSVLDGMYWAITTVTTVGYGDVVATTAGGKILASLVMIIGILLISTPISVVGTLFHIEWFKRRTTTSKPRKSKRISSALPTRKGGGLHAHRTTAARSPAANHKDDVSLEMQALDPLSPPTGPGERRTSEDTFGTPQGHHETRNAEEVIAKLRRENLRLRNFIVRWIMSSDEGEYSEMGAHTVAQLLRMQSTDAAENDITQSDTSSSTSNAARTRGRRSGSASSMHSASSLGGANGTSNNNGNRRMRRLDTADENALESAAIWMRTQMPALTRSFESEDSLQRNI